MIVQKAICDSIRYMKKALKIIDWILLVTFFSVLIYKFILFVPTCEFVPFNFWKWIITPLGYGGEIIILILIVRFRLDIILFRFLKPILYFFGYSRKELSQIIDFILKVIASIPCYLYFEASQYLSCFHKFILSYF